MRSDSPTQLLTHALFAALLIAVAWVAMAPRADEDAPGPGHLVSIGSGSMTPMMHAWARDFERGHPGVRVDVVGRGSSTAPPALISGRANLGPMTRKMKASEIAAYEAELGYGPEAVRVALDAVVVFVNPSNSLDRLTLPDLDRIFSRTRLCGSAEAVSRWGDVGTEGEWAGRRIVPCGRTRASGTRSFFQEVALCGGSFRENTREQPGAASSLRSVAEGFCGIGYGGLAGLETTGVKLVAVAPESSAAYVSPTREEIYGGAYPLTRFLYLYVLLDESGALQADVEAFLSHVLSPAGQRRVEDSGMLALPGRVIDEERSRLRLGPLAAATPPAR